MDGFCIGGVRVKEQILSVGIDIGTSTTQLVFSKLYIENRASVASIPRINIVGKEIIYKSDIYFTPLISNTERIGRFIILISSVLVVIFILRNSRH